MNTHIIIPIADIYKMIQDYNKLVQEAAKDRTDNGKFNFVRYGAKSSVLTKLLLETGKQISLDEDLISLAEKTYPETTAVSTHNSVEKHNQKQNLRRIAFIRGYKELLKDLI